MVEKTLVVVVGEVVESDVFVAFVGIVSVEVDKFVAVVVDKMFAGFGGRAIKFDKVVENVVVEVI